MNVVPASKYGDFPECPEPYCTFLENALAKARHCSGFTGQPSLADDSGLCVDYLNGAPGVLSARFAGDNPKDGEKNKQLLLEKMKGVTNRHAHFTCVLAYVRYPADPQPIIVEGEWHGEIALKEEGYNGFGYDPLFWLPDFNMTAGSLPRAYKNSISHLAIACKRFLDRIHGE